MEAYFPMLFLVFGIVFSLVSFCVPIATLVYVIRIHNRIERIIRL